MKFKFVISETENLFFLISNLANWHFSCRPDYNAAWLKTSGPLTQSEKKILGEFSDLMKKHGFVYRNDQSIYLGRAFFVPPENKKWRAVESMLDDHELALTQDAFRLFKSRFKKVWYEKQLKQWERVLTKKLRDQKVKNIFSGIERFLGAVEHQTIFVHLIASPSIRRAVSGGANLGIGHMTLEVPVFKMSDWNIGNALAIMAHESAHPLVDDKNIQKLLNNFLRVRKSIIPSKVLRGRKHRELLHELIADICAPYGYFCSGVFGIYEPTTDILFRSLGNAISSYEGFADKVVWAMYPAVAEYAVKNKKIDALFLEKLAATVKALTS